jgi:hypothetical protein
MVRRLIIAAIFFYSSSIIRLILGQTALPFVLIRSIYARFSHRLIALS